MVVWIGSTAGEGYSRGYGLVIIHQAYCRCKVRVTEKTVYLIGIQRCILDIGTGSSQTQTFSKGVCCARLLLSIPVTLFDISLCSRVSSFSLVLPSTFGTACPLTAVFEPVYRFGISGRHGALAIWSSGRIMLRARRRCTAAGGQTVLSSMTSVRARREV